MPCIAQARQLQAAVGSVDSAVFEKIHTYLCFVAKCDLGRDVVADNAQGEVPNGGWVCQHTHNIVCSVERSSWVQVGRLEVLLAPRSPVCLLLRNE
jgi:hypothetical protein